MTGMGSEMSYADDWSGYSGWGGDWGESAYTAYDYAAPYAQPSFRVPPLRFPFPSFAREGEYSSIGRAEGGAGEPPAAAASR